MGGVRIKNDQHVQRQHQEATEAGNADDVGERMLSTPLPPGLHKQEATEAERVMVIKRRVQVT